MQDLGLFWQLTIKTIEDLGVVGNENLTLQMYIMQMIHLKNLDEKEFSIRDTESSLSLNKQQSFSQNNDKEDTSPDINLSNKVKNQLKIQTLQKNTNFCHNSV